ncbi:hypothetical protein AWB69_09271 [Caballeronia udeis]|uniref:Uncharacterized protein n=1 Tax=Caballeronia udeis TaxID=1232866 RepID=A0A158K228_9BURK|nr:hypothetical protein AWB69_09271 [Caballeronia udeis]
MRNASSITLTFMTALSKRLPESTTYPADSFNGFAYARITSRSGVGTAARSSASVRPVTVRTAPLSLPASSSSFITAGTPPAR